MKRLIILHVFGILRIVVANLRSDIYECGDPVKNYTLNPGDMFMVQSPSFPERLTTGFDHENVKCGMTFTRADGKDFGLYFIFMNGYTFGYEFSSPDGKVEEFKERFNGYGSKNNDAV
uniref:Uncharacterized protein n=1 Tax=Panagrolaimus sp. JU765 TaxID=591449 RepID=A0AC34R5A4_9BILA